MDNTYHFPSLLGDGNGCYRVNIVGNSEHKPRDKIWELTFHHSGAGKSTLGIALARILGVPYISMDKIMWKPGWGETAPEEFRARLRILLDQNPERGWVADGNYDKRGGGLVFEESTDVIWLDPPLLLYFPRIILRTFLRLLQLEEPCSPGCPERLSRAFFSKESIIWWCISNHWRSRAHNQARMREIGVGIGSNVERRRMRHLGGWGGDLKKWLKEVEDMVGYNTRQKRD